MKHLKLIALCALLAVSASVASAQQKPALGWKEVSSWRYIKPFNTTLSPDGQWLAYVTGPVDGDQEVVLKKVADSTIYRYPCGANANAISFSEDGRFAAFKVSPKDAEAKAAKKTNKTLYDKLLIVNLASNTKTEFDRVKSFSFSGKAPNWVAISFAALETASKDKDAAKGTDLLLYNIQTKKSFNLGACGEFEFNKAGNMLAYTIDANDKNGNGIYVYNIKTGVTTALDNDKAVYKFINWNEEGTAFALLKANKDDNYKTSVYSVIGVTKAPKADSLVTTIYDGLKEPSVPAGMGISGDRRPCWTDDQSTLIFGISTLEKSDKAKKDTTTKGAKTATTQKDSVAKKRDDVEKPDMIIWNWQDKRLQSAQTVQENADKTFSYLAEYRVPEQRFIRLADSNMRTVNVAPKQLYALGIDGSKYELTSNLDGQNYADIYLINLKTGDKKLLFDHFYRNANPGFVAAPNGKLASYYQDGAFYSINVETGEKHNLTGDLKTSFIDMLDDHNTLKPSTNNLGWSADSKYILIADNHDLWRISADGKSAVSLTTNWKSNKTAVMSRFRIYPEEKGIDLQKPQYFNVLNRSTKQGGIARLEGDHLTMLFSGDYVYDNVMKAKNSNVYAYSKENYEHAPEIYVTAAPDLSAAKQITKNTPDQEKYAWSAGVKLINYVSANGDSLQAALFLPANYQPGKAYPTITYIYERLTDGLNSYTMPGFPGTGFNKALYTSNGYAVLMPDIKYKLNDPGMSTVACVVPAVKAAVATGVVDPTRVAIHGHSWGGYQTAFLITQTNIFKAAAAGAPLTDMISMYSLIYWNSGSTNQSIFEASQGRLTPGY